MLRSMQLFEKELEERREALKDGLQKETKKRRPEINVLEQEVRK